MNRRYRRKLTERRHSDPVVYVNIGLVKPEPGTKR